MSGEPVPVNVCINCEKESSGEKCDECESQTKTVWIDHRRKEAAVDKALQEYNSTGSASRNIAEVQNSVLELRQNMNDLKITIDKLRIVTKT